MDHLPVKSDTFCFALIVFTIFRQKLGHCSQVNVSRNRVEIDLVVLHSVPLTVIVFREIASA